MELFSACLLLVGTLVGGLFAVYHFVFDRPMRRLLDEIDRDLGALERRLREVA